MSPIAAPPAILFDDFRPVTPSALRAHGWTIRTRQGWPGMPQARFLPRNVTVVSLPGRADDAVLRLQGTTDGTPAGTTEAQVCQARKFRDGTYATRVRFRDVPSSGPDGDAVVETFYAISPLRRPLDPAYSETDFEYLPNGGWQTSRPAMHVTSWETFRPVPHWLADNETTASIRSLDGWHTLVLQVSRAGTRYFVDGSPLARYGARTTPESLMSINYNLWFVQGGLVRSAAPRVYEEDVDWILHVRGQQLTPTQMSGRVAALRRAGVGFRDDVPAARPALRSPCDL